MPAAYYNNTTIKWTTLQCALRVILSQKNHTFSAESSTQ